MGRYTDADKVRFIAGKPQKIRGWSKFFPTALTGVPRGVLSFVGPTGQPVLAAGTESHLYFVDSAGNVADITPLRAAAATINNNPIATTNASAVVTITDTAHGASTGARVTIAGATAVGGITVVGTYTLTVINDNSYTITHGSAATSTASGGGAAVTAAYTINPGQVSSAASSGYGSGAYGMEAYGTPRTLSMLTLEHRHWSLHNYGDNLLATPGTGGVYLYDDDVDTTAQPIANSPTDCRYSFVTEERFIHALCDDMYVRWADVDDITDWSPSELDTANTRRLQVGSKLIAGASLGGGITLIWTDRAVYTHQYRGDEFIYETRLAGEFCGLVGPGAFAIADGLAFWVSQGGFYMFAGGPIPIPNQDEIRAWVFDNMSVSQRSKSVAFFNPLDREVWFLFPGPNSTEPDRYAMVNIEGWIWTIGNIQRVGATTSVDAPNRPILADANGYLYEHELEDDYNADGSAMDWYLETGLYRPEGGGGNVDIFGMSPDFERQSGDIEVLLSAKARPNSTLIDDEILTFTEQTEIADARVQGRYFKFRMSQTDVVDGDFRLGVPVLLVQPAGDRP